jgi:hypothetical protein
VTKPDYMRTEPISVQLANEDNEAVSRITYVDRREGRPEFESLLFEDLLRMTVGPLSLTVLVSLQRIGLPAQRQERAELSALIDTDLARPNARAVDRAVLAWRLNGLVGRLAEQLGGLVHAVDRWHGMGDPTFARCQLGEDFLKFEASNPRETLAQFTTATAARRLMRYPQASSLISFLSTAETKALERRLRRSAKATASGFADVADAMTDETHRTFIRWKHGVSITSPEVVPIWITRQDAERKRLALEGLISGFGIIDITRGRGQRPYLIIWPDSAQQLVGALALADTLLTLTTLVLESVLCWGDPDISGIPVHPSVAAREHDRIVEKLVGQGYRRRVVLENFVPSPEPGES